MKNLSSKAIITILIATVGVFIARSFRVSEIPNGSENRCANCHINPAGGGARNNFGTEVENNFLDAPGASGHVEWGPALAGLDSDGDGFTNGEELQDPNGTWSEGNAQPGNSLFVTNPGDASDFPTPAIIVVSPNGGENYEPGEQIEILWESNLVSTVSIEHSSNNGGNWNIISAGSESNGSFNWIIPNISSPENKIRINDADSEAADQSNATFTISQPSNPILTVTSPNGGENWEAGTKNTITWTSTDVSSISIDFSTDNGTFWNEITATTISDGSFEWTIPSSIESNDCKIRIKDNDSNAEDQSDEIFSIFIPLNPQITVIAPNGGEEIEVGTQFEIMWTSADVVNVSIEFSSNNGASWNEVISSTESDGSFGWNVPNLFSEESLIRVSDLGSEAADTSEGVFTIFDPTGIDDKMVFRNFLDQNYPNPFNPSTTISFQLARVSDVDLKIFNSSGELIRTIVNAIIPAGQHNFSWNGRNQHGKRVSSGIYIYRLKAGSFIETKQMLLLK